MFDPSEALSGLRIPSSVLIALDNRDLHFALQPFHFLIRAAHVLSVAAFFGGIGLLDLRLIGARALVSLRGLADHALPWVYGTFAMAAVTGVLLFLYDPLHVGSHAYFSLKLILISLGLANAALFHGAGFAVARAADGRMTRHAKAAGATSLVFWTAAIVMSSMNVEGVPKVLLQAS